MSWQTFWERPNRIYAGQRHLSAHYARLFADVKPYLPERPESAILDFGCGDALAAEAMAEVAGCVWLYDSSPRVRMRLTARLAGNPKVIVCDDVESLADASIDLALLISVVQYLDAAALTATLASLRRVLREDGRLLVADIIEPGTSLARDIASRLRFAAAEDFLLADLAALARLLLSDYRRVRNAVGLATYPADTFAAILAAAGFSCEPLARNVGPTQHRRAFLAAPLPRQPKGALTQSIVDESDKLL